MKFEKAAYYLDIASKAFAQGLGIATGLAAGLWIAGYFNCGLVGP